MGSSAVFLVFFVVGCLPSVVTPLSESTNFPRDTNQYGSLVRHNNNQEEEEKDQELLLANNNNNNRRRRDQSLPISVGRAAFADTCSATLLGPAVTGDTFISQDEFASFVADYCVAQGVCNANLRLTFADLPRPVQSVFTNPQCESPSCSRDASSSDVVVGYLYTPATQETVIPLIQQMCFNAYPLVVDFVAPTPGAFCLCVCLCLCLFDIAVCVPASSPIFSSLTTSPLGLLLLLFAQFRQWYRRFLQHRPCQSRRWPLSNLVPTRS